MERFWSKVNKTETCWLWTASTYISSTSPNPKPYGGFKLNGKKRLAHRVAYELVVGPIPEGKILLHSCNNGRCVNPEHLKPGTYSENAMDAVRDGLMLPMPKLGYCRAGHKCPECN